MKHPLLPDQYVDASMHATILSALRPYERMPESADPHFRWDLRKAWAEAKPHLKNATWRYHGGDGEDTVDAGWEFTADTDAQHQSLQLMLAGIVAHQIDMPESEIAVRRVEYRKGGEAGLVIANHTQERFQQMFPEAHYEGFDIEAGRAEDHEKKSLFQKIKASFAGNKTR